nr:hypothetical protein [Candidatus Sigynarchaeota archaeon]
MQYNIEWSMDVPALRGSRTEITSLPNRFNAPTLGIEKFSLA